jgi:hypothetical protein
MAWVIQDKKLVGADGQTFDIFPQEMWHVAPARSDYVSGVGVVRPLEFAALLHNAFLGKGLVLSLSTLLEGIEPVTMKGGAGGAAERALEQIRQARYPDLPSRLRCYFLNLDRATAEKRALSMFRGARKSVRCHFVLNGGRYHFADLGVYEALEGRPDDIPLAEKYWSRFEPANVDEQNRLEILADSALYFPDWQDFSTLDDDVLLRWQKDNPPAGRGSLA